MANVNELKKELSKLSGVDFFNPKYRNVFKKYITTETEEVEKETNEEERLRNILGEEKETEVRKDDSVEDKVEVEEKVEKEDTEEKEELKTKEDIIDESKEDDEEESVETEEDDTEDAELEDEDTEEDFDEFEEDTEEEDDSNEESDVEEIEDTEEPTEEVEEKVATKEEYHEERPDYNKELIDTKVELGLVKAGVRDDRLEDARKLFMADFKGMEDLEYLSEFIKKYPEWIKKGVHDSKAFGMPTKDMGDGYTEEEKKLRSMGINPR